MNILAHRVHGTQVAGDIKFNHSPCSRSDMRKRSTFVEQEDALIGSLTIEETILYASQLSLGGLEKVDRIARVDEAIRSFGLDEARHVRIGTPLLKGCSGGQKRRVSVASQLITIPNIVFLDEPTSGLDSAASFEVCSRIRNLAQLHNMIVFASIHQPSSSIFNLFSKVLLLSKGRQLYFGHVSGVEEYFQNTEFPIPPHYNPADHLLDISNVDFHADKSVGMKHIEKLSGIWKGSPEAGQLNRILGDNQHIAMHPGGNVFMAQSMGNNFLSHVSVLLRRNILKAVRDPLAYGVRVAMYLGLAIMMGTVWLRLSASQNHINDFVTALFFGSAFMSFMAVAYIPAYLEDHACYVKERRNGLYGPAAFVVSNTIISVPFLYLIAIMFTVITYFMINFRHSATGFFQYSMWLFLDLLAAESLVVLISSAVPIFVAALALTAFANGLWMSVGGFLVSADVLNVFWYYTFYQIDYQRYVFDGLMRNEFLFRAYDCAADCNCLYPSALSSQCQIAGSVVLSQYGVGDNFDPGVYVAILFAITIFLRIATYVLLSIKR